MSRDSSVPSQVASAVSRVSLPPLPQPLAAGFRYLDPEDATSSPEREPESEPAEEIILAVDVRGNNSMGCAYYSTQSHALHLLNDMQSIGMDVLGSLVVQIQPTMVLTSFQAPESVVEFFDQDSQSAENGTVRESWTVNFG